MNEQMINRTINKNTTANDMHDFDSIHFGFCSNRSKSPYGSDSDPKKGYHKAVEIVNPPDIVCTETLPYHLPLTERRGNRVPKSKIKGGFPKLSRAQQKLPKTPAGVPSYMYECVGKIEKKKEE
jgi:hypothetical protein